MFPNDVWMVGWLVDSPVLPQNGLPRYPVYAMSHSPRRASVMKGSSGSEYQLASPCGEVMLYLCIDTTPLGQWTVPLLHVRDKSDDLNEDRTHAGNTTSCGQRSSRRTPSFTVPSPVG
ncbi:unnamed protein product [Ectocarpus sp. 12 AP-2014]